MESGRPAERAGVKDGDLLLEVNGESVESLKHRGIVERVRQSGRKVSVTTISPQGLEFYTKVGVSKVTKHTNSPSSIERKKNLMLLNVAAEERCVSLVLQLGLSPLLFCEEDYDEANETNSSKQTSSAAEQASQKETGDSTRQFTIG